MKLFACICGVLALGAILSGSLWAADYVSTMPPGGPLLRSLYASATGFCLAEEALYGGKTKATVDGVVIYQTYVGCSNAAVDTIFLYKLDTLRWYYSFTTASSTTYTGFLQTAY